MIAAGDLELLHFVDSPAAALDELRRHLRPEEAATAAPALARTVTCDGGEPGSDACLADAVGP